MQSSVFTITRQTLATPYIHDLRMIFHHSLLFDNHIKHQTVDVPPAHKLTCCLQIHSPKFQRPHHPNLPNTAVTPHLKMNNPPEKVSITYEIQMWRTVKNKRALQPCCVFALK